MIKIEDIKMRKNENGIYDFSFADGDFTTVSGIDTAVQMSILCEKRASPSEESEPQKRRGWWGNEASDDVNFNIGSKYWLLLSARLTQKTLNKSIDFGKDCLQWMVDDKRLDKVEVSGEIVETTKLVNYFKLIKDNNVVTKGYDVLSKSFLDGDI